MKNDLILSVGKLKTLVNKMIFAILTVLLFSILSLVIWQVFSRYFLPKPAVFTEELVRFLLIWLGVIAAVYAFGAKQHIALTLLYNKFPYKTQKVLSIIHHITILIFACVFFIYGGFLLVRIASFQVSSVLGISMSYVYIVFPFSGIMLIVYEVFNLIEYCVSVEPK